MDLEDLKKKKLEDLRTIAKMFGVKSVTTKNKAQLIEAMQNIAAQETQQETSQAHQSEQVHGIEEVSIPEKTLSDDQEQVPQQANASEQALTSDAQQTPGEEKKAAKTKRENKSVHSNQNKVKEKKLSSNKERKEHQDEKKKPDRKLGDKKLRGKAVISSKGKFGGKKAKGDDLENTAETLAADQDVSVNNAPDQDREVLNKTTPAVVSEDNLETDIEKEKQEQFQNDEIREDVKEEENSIAAESEPSGPIFEEVDGVLEVHPDNYGFLRHGIAADPRDSYVAPSLIRKFNLKTGDYIKGKGRYQRENDRYRALCFINSINDDPIEVAIKRKPFETLTPIYPDSKIKLETEQNEISTRIIDLIAPIGKGQRGMIVSPPKAGKTILLKKIANAITQNHPEIKLIVLLIDERPEEVTDMRESVQGDVVSSTFDEMPEKHIKAAEMVFERAQRLVEHGKDVVILMDSLTRLARAYNITIPPTGRSLSGGLDPGALYKPKRFFGAARNIRGGGSLTIIATALIDTGSKMDDVIFEEFKGTGNMELHLDRKLSEKRVFPAIEINRSGTRKEELLLTEDELSRVYSIRKALSNAATTEVTEMIVNKMLRTKNNQEFLKTINIIAADK